MFPVDTVSPDDLVLLAAVADGDAAVFEAAAQEQVERLTGWGWLMVRREGLELTGAGWSQLGRAPRSMLRD